MDLINFRLIQEKFHNYVKSFYSENPIIHENIILKEDHSVRVCSISEKLAHALHFDKDEVNLVMAIAILHDIGRFPQFSRYQTFRDNLSVNHADLGLSVITETDILNGTASTEQQIICNAVSNHNRIEIEDGLDTRSFLHSQIIRDADKLDILPLMIEYYNTREYSPKPGLELTFPDTPGFNQEIIDKILLNQRVPNSIRLNYNDLKLAQLSWLLDLNFPFSHRYAEEHRFIQKLRDTLPNDVQIDKAVEHIYSVVKSRQS